MPTRISIAEKLGTFLQGRPLGRKHFGRLCELLSDAASGQIAMLDFQGVEIVTSSWINEALVPILRWAADERTELFPVLMNFDQSWLDDLWLVAELTHNSFLVSNARGPKSAKLVGRLDIAQRATLKAVVEASEITGAELERIRPADGVKATAWNNRLKDLHKKRLIRREKRGRKQVYSSIVKEVQIDG